MTKQKSIKLAGPDANGNYKVVSTTNTLMVENGEIFTRACVRRELLGLSGHNAPKVITVPPKYETIETVTQTFHGPALDRIPRDR